MFIKTIVGYTTVITIVTTVWTFYCLWSFFVEGFGQFGPWIEFDREPSSCSLMHLPVMFPSGQGVVSAVRRRRVRVCNADRVEVTWYAIFGIITTVGVHVCLPSFPKEGANESKY